MDRQKIRIRKATIDDIPTLITFEQGVIDVERNYDNDLKIGAITYYDIEKLINDSDSQLLVAVCKNALVGVGYAQLRESENYVKYEMYAYIGFIWVDPIYRGKRVSWEIIESLKKWSHQKGISNLKLEVYTKNESAIKAYKKCGFSECVVEMKIDISKE